MGQDDQGKFLVCASFLWKSLNLFDHLLGCESSPPSNPLKEPRFVLKFFYTDEQKQI